jgi:hypothetical protein
VAHEDYFGIMVDEIANCGKRSFDAGIVGDDAVGDGHVEVDAAQDAFAGYIGGIE